MFFDEGLDGQPIGVESEPDNRAGRGSRNHGAMSILFTGVNVGDVYLDDGSRHGSYGIAQGDGGVGVGTGIEHDAVARIPGLLNFVDEYSLDIGLEIVDAMLGIAPTQLLEKVVERSFPVDGLFPFAQQIEIGPVDNEYIHM